MNNYTAQPVIVMGASAGGVQDPADALAPDMPRSALACVEADHVVPLAALGPLRHDLASRLAAPAATGMVPPPEALRQEHAASNGRPMRLQRCAAQFAGW